MRKVFPTFAVLMAIMLAIWIVGCGEEEEECTDEVTVDTTAPADGASMASNAAVTVKFTGGTPDADSVTIAGKAAKCTGASCTAADLGLTEGQTVNIEIAWTYCDGENTGSHTITGVKITVEDKDPPEIADSDPGDGDKDVDPDALKEDGVTVTFNEAMDQKATKTGNIYFEIGDEKISWLPKWEDEKTLFLEYKPGEDIGFETEVKLVIKDATDAAGNATDLEITFNTKAKE
jgi:hypothetical protein